MPKKRLSKSSLLWFIRSRSYVSIPDIRRRFNLGAVDEVQPIHIGHRTVYVGITRDAARILEDLVREGRIGIEEAPGILAHAATGAYVIPHANDHGKASAGDSEDTGGEHAIAC